MNKFQLSATLDDMKRLHFEQSAPLNQGENLTTTLTVEIPKAYCDYDFYLEFACPDGKKYVTPKLTAEFNCEKLSLSYDVENSLLCAEGLVLVQLAARNKTDRAKNFKSVRSNMSSFYVNGSVNAASNSRTTIDYFAKTENVLAVVLDKAAVADLAVDKALETAAAVSSLGEKIDAALSSGELRGLKGEQGDKGEQGAMGPQGEKGANGEGIADVEIKLVSQTESGGDYALTAVLSDGSRVSAGSFFCPKGDSGERGETGLKGDKGEQGEKGERGLSGERGYEGTKGEPGDSIEQLSVELLSEGVLGCTYKLTAWLSNGLSIDAGTFTSPKGLQGVQGAQGLRGADGPKGDKGDPGLKFTLSGSVLYISSL